jgi:CRP/FNR family transcriptional regulator
MYAPHLAPAARSHFPSGLPVTSEPVSLAGLFMTRPVETFSVGKAVFWQGDKATDVFHIAEGCLRLYRILPDGRRAITGFVFAGAVLGLALKERYGYTAEAVTPVTLRRIGRQAFHTLVDASAHLRPQLLDLISDEMASAQDQMITLGCKNAEERVATFFLTIARQTGADLRSPVEIALPMGRQDVADYLGLTIETVCRTISKLKRDGLLALQGQRTIRLRRMEQLQDLAGDMDEADEPSKRGIAVAHRAAWPH